MRKRAALPPRGSFDTGELHIDFDAGIATMDGEELHLTPIEYKLLLPAGA